VAADLAPDLRFYFAIVVVEIVVRGIADGTNNKFRDSVRLGPASDRMKWLPMNRLVLS
jgi:hypothetical protein